jgi:hypothetical protein
MSDTFDVIKKDIDEWIAFLNKISVETVMSSEDIAEKLFKIASLGFTKKETKKVFEIMIRDLISEGH